MRSNKYNVADKSKRRVYGMVFDSRLESEMYLVVRSEQEKDNIKDLELQKEFVLQDAFTDAAGFRHQKVSYFADFYFYDNRQKRYRVVDCKGMKTDLFRLKKKMFNHKFKDKGLFIEDNI